MAARVHKKNVSPRSGQGEKVPLVSLRAAPARPVVRRWLQSFLLDGVF